MDAQHTEYGDRRRQADDLYSQIYRIRKSGFQPMHIGLGTWGRTVLTATMQKQIAALTKERSTLMGKARRIKQRADAEARQPGKGTA